MITKPLRHYTRFSQNLPPLGLQRTVFVLLRVLWPAALRREPPPALVVSSANDPPMQQHPCTGVVRFQPNALAARAGSHPSLRGRGCKGRQLVSLRAYVRLGGRKAPILVEYSYACVFFCCIPNKGPIQLRLILVLVFVVVLDFGFVIYGPKTMHSRYQKSICGENYARQLLARVASMCIKSGTIVFEQCEEISGPVRSI